MQGEGRLQPLTQHPSFGTSSIQAPWTKLASSALQLLHIQVKSLHFQGEHQRARATLRRIGRSWTPRHHLMITSFCLFGLAQGDTAIKTGPGEHDRLCYPRPTVQLASATQLQLGRTGTPHACSSRWRDSPCKPFASASAGPSFSRSLEIINLWLAANQL